MEVWPAILTQSQAAAYLGWGRSKWHRIRASDGLPNPVKVPGSTRPHWRRVDLDSYIAKLPRHRGRGKKPGTMASERPTEMES